MPVLVFICTFMCFSGDFGDYWFTLLSDMTSLKSSSLHTYFVSWAEFELLTEHELEFVHFSVPFDYANKCKLNAASSRSSWAAYKLSIEGHSDISLPST